MRTAGTSAHNFFTLGDAIFLTQTGNLHQIFFPGKSNWLFDWRTDPIILALPQEFFRNCAILIGAGLVIFSLSLLIFTGIRDKKAGK